MVMESAQLPEHCLLEAGELPFSELVQFATREGRRPRPIYQIHKWFARRLGCAFRTLLVGAVEPATADFWKAYYQTASLQGLTVLDPFVGGGTSVVEATRLGASTIGVDVDPIACAITNAELSAAVLEDLVPTLRALQASVGQSLRPYYETPALAAEGLTPLHHFWVQVVACPGCTTVGEAHPNYLLAAEKGKPRWVFCRDCHTVHAIKEGQRSFTCKACRSRTYVDEGTVRNGAYTCRACDQHTPLISVGRSTGHAPAWRMFAIEATPRTQGQVVPMDERVFLRATDADREQAHAATAALQAELAADPAFLPTHAIEDRPRADNRLTDYGYRQWSQLFNDRQLLHLGRLARAIRALPASTRTAMGLAFSNHLTTNCSLTAYAAGWRRLTPLFSIRAYRHVPRPIEINPWVEGTGRGTYPNAVRQIMRAAQYARAPKEPGRRGGFRDVPSVAPRETPRVFSGNARELAGVVSNSVDIALTDPPYFDNVAYSELSDFFQPWLEHLALVPPASARRASVSRALSASRNADETVESFASELGEAFREIHRVLKPHGLLAFTFRHSTAEGWLAMARALARSGLRPVQVLPLPGEVGMGLHAHAGTSLWDAVLVFRKLDAPVPSEALASIERTAALASAAEWRTRFVKKRKLPFNAADYVNLQRACLVAASLGLYGRGQGDAVSLSEALENAAAT